VPLSPEAVMRNSSRSPTRTVVQLASSDNLDPAVAGVAAVRPRPGRGQRVVARRRWVGGAPPALGDGSPLFGD
jgi:hypothetical protein